MEHGRDIDSATATRAAPALLPAFGILAGTCAAPYLTSLPLIAAVALVVLGVGLGARPMQRNAPRGEGLGQKAVGYAVAGLGLGLLSTALRVSGEPSSPPRGPVEVVAAVASHPIRHDDSIFFHARVERWRRSGEVRRRDFDLQVTVPPEASPPAIGSVVRLRGYLKRSVGYANGSVARPGPWRMRLKSARFLVLEAEPGVVSRWAGRLRQRAEQAFEGTGARDRGPALARALLLGDRSRLPKAWQAALRRCGLAHLLAVSGLHVGLLAFLLLILAMPLRPPIRYLPALVGIALYLLLVGPRPAVLRASLMGLLGLSAVMLQRPPQGLNALACCAAGLALVDPSIVGDLGFQLSVAATGGILALAPILCRRWPTLDHPLGRSLAATIGAQLATLPWTAALMGGLHPLAPVLNLIAVPMLALFLMLSFLWLAVSVIAGANAGAALIPALDAGAASVEALARLPASPWLFLPSQVGGVPLTAGVALALWRPVWVARGALFACTLLLTGASARGPRPEAPVEVVMFDVGQGDAILLRDGRHTALVDGGGWPHGDFGGRILVPALARLGVDRLDAAILTHPDGDHCSGLVDVTRYLPVREVWMGPGWNGAPCAGALLGAAAGRWRVLWQGETATLGRWQLEVLHPTPGSRRGRNDRSLVLAARFGRHRVLLSGDVESATERHLLRRPAADLAASVLKVAHHGSRSSTTAAFLRAVSPRLALISSGPGNPYGHPHPRVLERLQSSGIRVMRTDRSGMVRLNLRASGKLSIALPGAPRRIWPGSRLKVSFSSKEVERKHSDIFSRVYCPESGRTEIACEYREAGWHRRFESRPESRTPVFPSWEASRKRPLAAARGEFDAAAKHPVRSGRHVWPSHSCRHACHV